MIYNIEIRKYDNTKKWQYTHHNITKTEYSTKSESSGVHLMVAILCLGIKFLSVKTWVLGAAYLLVCDILLKKIKILKHLNIWLIQWATDYCWSWLIITIYLALSDTLGRHVRPPYIKSNQINTCNRAVILWPDVVPER